MKVFGAGNSLIEYVLPLSVFFIAGLALIFAADVPARLQAYMGDTMNGDLQGTTISVAPLGTPPVETSASNGGIPALVETSGGAGLYDTPPGFEGAETAGGMGVEERPEASSRRLDRVVSQLERENADPYLISLVTKVANQGHEIARTEAAMPKSADVNSSQVLSTVLQSLQGDLKKKLIQDHTELQNYLNAHPELAERYPGAFDRINREVAKIQGYVDGLHIDGSEINVSGIDAYGAMYGYGGGYYGEPVVSGTLKIGGSDSDAVEGSSNTVCTSGGNTSSCVQDSSGNASVTTSSGTSTTTVQSGGGG